MSLQLGQTNTMKGIEQFTPEIQEQLFRRGVDGIDITNGIPRRGPSPEQMEELNRLRAIDNMVQNGELIPRQNMQRPVYQQTPVQLIA